ncbi:MAG: 50S ribosomal protein L32 [Myxococcales bacterium]|nr:50S ribosomal protein L32 [Myxococcales bacterium]
MAVQKRRQSSARRDSRRAQWMASVKQPQANRCQKCGEPRLPHRVCLACGDYGGKTVIEVAKPEGE